MKLSSKSPVNLTLAAVIACVGVPAACFAYYYNGGSPTLSALLALISAAFGVAVMAIDDEEVR